jgi:hypothetical protein
VSVRLGSACVVVAGWLVAAPVSAQGPLVDAEEAYLEVDFERTLSEAQSAIDSGDLGPSELARAYELLGVSAAALGDADTARDCFLRMLSIDETRQLDDTVPPRLRAPFMEARGELIARADSLSVEVVLARAYSALRITLDDPFEMIQGIRLHVRVEGGDGAWTIVEEDYEPEIMAGYARAAAADRLEYWLEVLDPRGNRILVRGSEFEPEVVGRPVPAAAGGGGTGEGPAPTGGGTSIAEEPAFWIVLGSVVLVGAGIGIGFGVDAASRVSLVTQVSF